MKNIDLNNLAKNDPVKLLQRMSKSFELEFNDDFFLKWIKQVKNAIVNKDELLPLADNEKGVFFDIFIDFHRGAFSKKDFAKLDLNLQEFCDICGKIESLTDSWPILCAEEQEPSNEDKMKLLELVNKFLQIFPKKESFNSWIKNSLEHLSN